MTAVIIQPSYGNAQSRRNFASTLDQAVEFSESPFAEKLDQAQFSALSEAHPSGSANFWAVTANQRPNFDRVQPGDLVLFTGQRHIQGIGRVVEKVDSPQFAHLMWPPHPDRGSYRLIYSLEGFSRVKVPYEGLRTALGRPDGGDNFMGMRVVGDSERVHAVMELLDWEPELTGELADAASELSESLRTLSPERAREFQSSYETESRTVIVRQIESLLREHFRTCYDGQIEEFDVEMVGGGHPDLYFEMDSSRFLCEAKPSSEHVYIRTALGQILDYDFNVKSPVDQLAVLLPDRPSSRDVELFHRHDVTVIYRDGESGYSFEAPQGTEKT